MPPKPVIKKHLNADSLIDLVRKAFSTIEDNRDENKSHKLDDMLMSAFAMFSLKCPSLLAFKNKYSTGHGNLQSVYKIPEVPGDTRMREVIDEIEPPDIKAIFPKVFEHVQRGNQLLPFRFMGKYYLVSGDGTEYFSSKTICCNNCMKRNRRDGDIEYYHQFYGAAIVHPDMKQVIPLAAEPIVKQDGNNKNDCERNAAKRFMKNLKLAHPKLPIIIIEDSLSSNAPHIKEVTSKNFRYILGVKESDHKYLFNYVNENKKKGNVVEQTLNEGNITHIFSFINNAPLNSSNQEVKVNFLEYWEVNNITGKTQHFSFVTDFTINISNVPDIMRGGRARWKIENETFNTLKNQGYRFNHNFGHGNKNLSVNFALLMMLAFLIDQVLELSCNLFQGAKQKSKQRIRLWEKVRELFNSFQFESMNQIYEAIVCGYEKPKIKINTS
jgi:hypothetical protein